MKWLSSSNIRLVLTGVLSFAVMAPAAEDAWTYKADMPTARTWVGGCVLDGKIYVIGGGRSDSSATSAVEMYDPLVDTWTKMADIPSARCYPATCTFKGKIYVFGGSPGVWSSALKSVFLYDPQTGAWTQKTDMPYAIGTCGIAVVENMIYLMGGTMSVSSPPVSTVMAYDPMTESWTRKADMPTAREGFSACVVDGKIYAIGGCKEDWQVFAYKLVEVYDPATNTWTRKSDMPTERWSLSACVVEGRIYAIGGCSNMLQASTANEVYDPVADTWTTKSLMQQKRLGHFVGLIGDKIYAMGGHYPNLFMVSKTEEYDTGLTVVPSPDFNGDGTVDIQDLLRLIESWGQNDPSVDIAPPPFGDGVVDKEDLEVLMSYWGQEIPDPALIGHWRLDEVEGTVAADGVGANDGALVGDPAWQATAGKLSGALLLNGVNDCVSTTFVLDPAAGPFSVFVWVKDGGPGQVILSQASGANWLMAGAPSGALVTELKESGRKGKPLVSAAVITDGNWHQVGLSWDGTNRILYVDGVEVARDKQANLAGSAGNLSIGAGSTMSPAGFWKGLIDDVRIYDRAVKP